MSLFGPSGPAFIYQSHEKKSLTCQVAAQGFVNGAPTLSLGSQTIIDSGFCVRDMRAMGLELRPLDFAGTLNP